jgi:hypothetical protein
MPLPIYLAMTAAELRQNEPKSHTIAWMACHFSPYGTGLSNCPKQLPPGAMLILNDRTPVCGHDPSLIAEQMKELAEYFGCSRVLLDLQRPGEHGVDPIIESVLAALPCPAGVSECYAGNFDCPVFLPPVPLLQTAEEYLSPWRDREIWLELALSAGNYRVTEQGCSLLPFSPGDKRIIHKEERLHCQYSIDIGKNAVTFSIERSREDLQALQAEAERLGVKCFVGLYQELGSSDQ